MKQQADSSFYKATDKAIGDLIQKMKDLELYDNFTLDHGEMMGVHAVKPL